MPFASFVLADRQRLEQFHLLGQSRRRLRPYATWTDDRGLPWAGRRLGNHGLAFTWLGPGWVFDSYAVARRAGPYAERLRAWQQVDETRHGKELEDVWNQLRLGPLAERLLWAIHAAVLAARRSVVLLPDRSLRALLWGPAAGGWPAQWRQEIQALFNGLRWLHAADWPDEAPPRLGAESAMLTHAADLRGDPRADRCDACCPGRAGPAHHHFLVNVGKGFLGLLEQFARPEDATGVRHYEFRVAGRKSSGPSLRQVGKTGRLVTVYLPAKLGNPKICNALTAGQHRLLQALVREITRRSGRSRGGPAVPEWIGGGRIPTFTGSKEVACPLLPSDGPLVGFNGNGVRKGLGYYLNTPGGWLAKAGYALTALPTFLADLTALARPLGLKIVGVPRSPGSYLDLDAVRVLAAAPGTRSSLAQVQLRVYADADYHERWDTHFGWYPQELAAARVPDTVRALLQTMEVHQVSRRALATGIATDPSLLSKLLNGKKRWPPGLLEKARAWMDGRAAKPQGPALPPTRILPASGPTLLPVGLAYLRRGWSVVPQLPGAKQPCVRWKEFQSRRPSEAELAAWFQQWPRAGLVVVLGPVSGLLAIDVDGLEAHEELLRRLGAEPRAPKALSGSGLPCRYHLFFTHPDVPTKAKAVPWHPKLEFRGQGGVLVLPPSTHKSGKRYAWAPGQSPEELLCPEIPGPIRQALQPLPSPAVPGALDPAFGRPTVGSPSTRRFLAGDYANGPGWNERLFRAACDLAGRDVPRDVAEGWLLAGARPWNATEKESAGRTIASAFSQPRSPGRH